MTDKLEKTLLKIYVKNVPVQNTELPKIFAVLVDWYNHIILTLCFKPQIRRVSCRQYCALYKFIYLSFFYIYLVKSNSAKTGQMHWKSQIADGYIVPLSLHSYTHFSRGTVVFCRIMIVWDYNWNLAWPYYCCVNLYLVRTRHSPYKLLLLLNHSCCIFCGLVVIADADTTLAMNDDDNVPVPYIVCVCVW